MINDTIAAISTAVGEGGIAIIRISGPEAIEAAAGVFRSQADLRNADTHTVHYGHIVDRGGTVVDEVLVTVMRAPRTFTAEDVVEVNTHGGIVAVKRVLDLLLLQPAIRLAEPGEFTKRAFLNGRIDLAQAEAVIDLIRSKSDRAMSVALKQVGGSLSKRIKGLRHQLIELLAHIEVNIDYPEHDVEEMTSNFIRERSGEVLDEIGALLKRANEGKILREGIVTAIVGRPNVGKSSLLNALTQNERAIVTDIPGTTRDVIEEYVTVGGIPLKLLDTAGIRETEDIVEQIGVERSRSALGDADLILLVLNWNEPLQPDDYALLEQMSGRKAIVILNKIDLPQRMELEPLQAGFAAEQILKMSVLEEQGLEQLERCIADLFFGGQLDTGDMNDVSNVRHISLLAAAKQSLHDAIASTDIGLPIDVIQIDVRRAWELLGEIIGESAAESLIDQIFAQFCLGK